MFCRKTCKRSGTSQLPTSLIQVKSLGPQRFIQSMFLYQALRKCGFSLLDVFKLGEVISLELIHNKYYEYIKHAEGVMKMVAQVPFISILKHFGKLDEDLCQLGVF